MACNPASKPQLDGETQTYLSNFQKENLSFQVFSSPEESHVWWLVFNQPMVGLTERHKTTNKIERLIQDPRFKGNFQWIDPQTLLIQAKEAFPPELNFVAEAGLESLLGTALLRPVPFTLTPFQLEKANLSDVPQQRSSLTREFKDIKAEIFFPQELWVGEKVLAILKIENILAAPQEIEWTLTSELFENPIQQKMTLEPNRQYEVPITLSADHYFKSKMSDPLYLKSFVGFFEVAIRLEFLSPSESQTLTEPLKIYPNQKWIRKSYFGALTGAGINKVLSEFFVSPAEGELNLQFNLDAKELMQNALRHLTHLKTTNDISMRVLSLMPFVLFPESLLVFGSEEAGWEASLNLVKTFLNETLPLSTSDLIFERPLSQIELLSHFFGLALDAGFIKQESIKFWKEGLLKKLEAPHEPHQEILLLSALSRIYEDQAYRYAPLFNNYSKLLPEAQFKLARMMLALNPLHPVLSLIKQSLDKQRTREADFSSFALSEAFETLVGVSPKDSLTYEVFSRLLKSLNQESSPQTNYDLLTAFKFYLAHLSKAEETVKIKLNLNDIEILESNLNWKNRKDELFLPLNKLPQSVVLTAQKQEGVLAFYQIDLNGLAKPESIGFKSNGVRVSQACYDNLGQYKLEFERFQTYQCHIRFFAEDDFSDFRLQITKASGLIYTPLKAAKSAKLTLKDPFWQLDYSDLKKGPHEFIYTLRPTFEGVYPYQEIRAFSAATGQEWGFARGPHLTVGLPR